jgi:hypothetical protein
MVWMQWDCRLSTGPIRGGLFCLKTELKILCYCLLTVKKTTYDGGAGLPGCRIFHDDIWTDAEHGGVVIHLRLDILHTLYSTWSARVREVVSFAACATGTAGISTYLTFSLLVEHSEVLKRTTVVCIMRITVHALSVILRKTLLIESTHC